jgi:hypothetical protein
MFSRHELFVQRMPLVLFYRNLLVFTSNETVRKEATTYQWPGSHRKIISLFLLIPGLYLIKIVIWSSCFPIGFLNPATGHAYASIPDVQYATACYTFGGQLVPV